MGVRLVIHNFEIDEMDYTGTHNHDDLLHRDLVDQHPIYAITGLQEVLNTIENNLINITNLIQNNDLNVRNDLKTYTDTQVSNLGTQIDTQINNLNVVDHVKDTKSIDLDYDSVTNTLKANVIAYNDPGNTNSLAITDDGLYVPKLVTQDTDTITWDSVSHGEPLSRLFINSIHFSHNNTNNNMYDASEANSWYFDDSLESFIQSQSTSTYNGFVTNDFYDYYRHTVKISSNDSDDDINGIILGFMFDENNNPHTLSALIQKGSDFGSWNFAIYYNFYLPGQILVANYTIPNSSDGWSDSHITLYATKDKNIVSVSVTDWNYNNTLTNIDDAALMPFVHTHSFDLSNYSWGHYFNGKVRYGYSNLSQAYTSFSKIFFDSKDQRAAQDIFANIKVQDTPHNAIQVNNNGLFVQEFLISQKEDNALSQKEDGYYVKTTPMSISNQRLNGLEEPSNGEYYVHKSHSFIDVIQTNHNFKLGDFIYYDYRTNLYQKATAIDSFDINIVGMVSYIYNNNKFEYVCSGFVETDLFNTDHDFVQGMPLYISDTNPGKVTQEQPDISKTVGYPVADLGLIISIERGIQYSKEAQIGDFKTSANDYNIRSDGFIKVKENIDYKLSLVSALLQKTNLQNYISINQESNTMQFININNLYNDVPNGLNLFIKAF